MDYGTFECKGVTIVRIDRGEDVLQTIRRAVTGLAVANGVAISGCGSVDSYRIHAVASASYPPGDYSDSGEGALQIQSVQGVIASGEPHLHIVLADRRGAFGGHLEEGCRALTLCEVAILHLGGGTLERYPDPEYPNSGIRQLRVR